MARGYVRRAMDVVDTTPPRPLKTVSQKLGRLLGISKQVDPLDSFLLLEPLHDHVQPLPPLPEPLAIKTNASRMCTKSSSKETVDIFQHHCPSLNPDLYVS